MSTVKVYYDGSYKEAEVYYFDGERWLPCTVHYFDGTRWL